VTRGSRRSRRRVVQALE